MRCGPAGAGRGAQGERAERHLGEPQWWSRRKYRCITGDGLLRQASYKGLRRDKAGARSHARNPGRFAGDGAAPAVRKSAATTAKARPPAPRIGRNPCARKAAQGQNRDIGNVHLTHPTAFYGPMSASPKQDLAAYYVGVWDWMAPGTFSAGRSRWSGAPEGVGGETFLSEARRHQHKVLACATPSPVRNHDVIAVETARRPVALVQSAPLEIHVRGSRLDSPGDLRPHRVRSRSGGRRGLEEIVAAAGETRERLKAQKLESFRQALRREGRARRAPIVVSLGPPPGFSRQRIVMAMAATARNATSAR